MKRKQLFAALTAAAMAATLLSTGALAAEDTTAPADDKTASDTTTPAADDKTATPAAEDKTAPPAADDKTTTPTTEDKTTTPTTEDKTAAPAADDKTAAPAADDKTETPPAKTETVPADDKTLSDDPAPNTPPDTATRTPASPIVYTPEETAPVTGGITAQPTSSLVVINSKSVLMEAYNIDGNNYFKLRDLASALLGSTKQFDIAYNAGTNAIALTSGIPYTPVGGELSVSDGLPKQAFQTSSAITCDGKALSFTVYRIGGNNYFKLRDIGQLFNFGVSYDATDNAIRVDTSIAYTAE